MMFNFGVIAVSMNGFDVTDTGGTVSGLNARLVAAQKSGKAVVLTNFSYNGKMCSPVPAVIYDGSSGAKVALTAIGTATVSAADVVTIS